MPLIGGMCAPNICFRCDFDTTGARLAAVKQNGQPVNDPVKLQALMMVYGAAYNNALATFKQVRIDCDGCHCSITNPNAPWVALQPYFLAVDQISNYTVQIAGIRARVKWGVCYPPGTKVKVGKKEIPVEELIDGEPPKSGSSGSGHKKGTKKKKKVTKKKVAGQKTRRRR
jgi:hypothetical protein